MRSDKLSFEPRAVRSHHRALESATLAAANPRDPATVITGAVRETDYKYDDSGRLKEVDLPPITSNSTGSVTGTAREEQRGQNDFSKNDSGRTKKDGNQISRFASAALLCFAAQTPFRRPRSQRKPAARSQPPPPFVPFERFAIDCRFRGYSFTLTVPQPQSDCELTQPLANDVAAQLVLQFARVQPFAHHVAIHSDQALSQNCPQRRGQSRDSPILLPERRKIRTVPGSFLGFVGCHANRHWNE